MEPGRPSQPWLGSYVLTEDTAAEARRAANYSLTRCPGRIAGYSLVNSNYEVDVSDLGLVDAPQFLGHQPCHIRLGRSPSCSPYGTVDVVALRRELGSDRSWDRLHRTGVVDPRLEVEALH